MLEGVKRGLPEGAPYRLAYVLLGGALLAVPIVAVSGRVPSLMSPFPAWFIWPLLLLGPLALLLALVVPIAFWALLPELAAGHYQVQRSSKILALVVAIASVLWTGLGYSSAVQHQGHNYAVGLLIINTTVPTAVALAMHSAARMRSWSLAFASQWLLFAWTASYAFAYIGEVL